MQANECHLEMQPIWANSGRNQCSVMKMLCAGCNVIAQGLPDKLLFPGPYGSYCTCTFVQLSRAITKTQPKNKNAVALDAKRRRTIGSVCLRYSAQVSTQFQQGVVLLLHPINCEPLASRHLRLRS